MATLTIRNLPDDVRKRLRVRAAENGHSMEAEARQILAASVAAADSGDQPKRKSGPRIREAAVRPDAATVGLTVDERATWTEFRALVRANLPSDARAGDVVDQLLRDRRRENIQEICKEGEDPRAVFGDNYAETLASAGLSEFDVEALRRHLEEPAG